MPYNWSIGVYMLMNYIDIGINPHGTFKSYVYVMLCFLTLSLWYFIFRSIFYIYLFVCDFFIIIIDYEAGHLNRHKLLAQFHSWSNYKIIFCQNPFPVMTMKISSFSLSNLESSQVFVGENKKGSKATNAPAWDFQTKAEQLMFSHSDYSEIGGWNLFPADVRISLSLLNAMPVVAWSRNAKLFYQDWSFLP